MTARRSRGGLTVEARPACPVCAGPGDLLHAEVDDGFGIVGGTWSFRRCRDPRCGHGWLDPAPTPDSLPAAYEGYTLHEAPGSAPDAKGSGQTSAGRRGWTGRAYGALLAASRTNARRASLERYGLGAGRGARLLEVGCGNGARLARLAAAGYRAEGQEVAPAGAVAASALGLQVHVGDLGRLGLAAGSFDVVAMNHVLEHVPDPRALLAEIHRLLRPGGRLVSIQPNVASRAHATFGRDWVGLDPPRHLHLFSPASAARLAAEAGFRRVRARTTTARAEACAGESLRRRDLRLRRSSRSAKGQATVPAPRYREMAVHQLKSLAAAPFAPGRGDEIVLRGVR